MAIAILSLACGTAEMADPRDYILEGAISVKTTNYQTHLSADTVPPGIRNGPNAQEHKARMLAVWGEEEFNLGQSIEEVGQVLTVDSRQGTYHLVSGSFDLDQVEEWMSQKTLSTLREDWKDKDIIYWEMALLNSGREVAPGVSVLKSRGVILLPDRNLYLVTDEKDIGRDFAVALDTDAGFISAPSAVTRLLAEVDAESFMAEVSSDCSMDEDLDLEGCLGIAWAAALGDANSARVSYAILFDSANSAESAVPDIKADIEEETSPSRFSVEASEVETRDDFVLFTWTLTE